MRVLFLYMELIKAYMNKMKELVDDLFVTGLQNVTFFIVPCIHKRAAMHETVQYCIVYLIEIHVPRYTKPCGFAFHATHASHPSLLEHLR